MCFFVEGKILVGRCFFQNAMLIVVIGDDHESLYEEFFNEPTRIAWNVTLSWNTAHVLCRRHRG